MTKKDQSFLNSLIIIALLTAFAMISTRFIVYTYYPKQKDVQYSNLKSSIHD
jgi:hypothetical protein